MYTIKHSNLYANCSGYRGLCDKWCSDSAERRSYRLFLKEEADINFRMDSNSIVFNTEQEYMWFLLRWS